MNDFQVICFGSGEGSLRAMAVYGTNLKTQTFIKDFCEKHDIACVNGTAFDDSLSSLIDELEVNQKTESWSIFTDEIFAEEKFLQIKTGKEDGDYRSIKVPGAFAFDFFTAKGVNFASELAQREPKLHYIGGVIFADNALEPILINKLGKTELCHPLSVFNINDYDERLNDLKQGGYQWELSPEYKSNLDTIVPGM